MVILGNVILISPHNITFCGDIWKIIQYPVSPYQFLWLLFLSINELEHGKTNKIDLCAQRRPRSGRADQSLHCPREGAMVPWLSLRAHTEDADQTRQMPRMTWVFTGRTGHFDRFVMLWFKCSIKGFTITLSLQCFLQQKCVK